MWSLWESVLWISKELEDVVLHVLSSDSVHADRRHELRKDAILISTT